MTMPPDLGKRWSDTAVEPDVEQAYCALLDKLLVLEADRDSSGALAPYKLELSGDAKTLWVRFYDRFAQEQAAAEGERKAALSKLEGYAARFTLLHHVVSRVQNGQDDRDPPIGPESVQAGSALAWWFAGEARRIYTTLNESREERESRRLVEFIRDRGGQITVKTLQRSNSRKWRTAGEAEAALDELVQAGAGRWEEKSPGPQGGRPTRWFLLQAPDETDETPLEGEEDDEEGDGGSGGAPTKPPTKTPGTMRMS